MDRLDKESIEKISKFAFEELLGLLRFAKFKRFDVILQEREKYGTGKLPLPDQDRFTYGSRMYEEAILDEIRKRIKSQWTNGIIREYLKEGGKLPSIILNAESIKKGDIIQLIKPGRMGRTVPGTKEVIEKPLPEFIPKIGVKQINKEDRIFFRHGEHEYFIKYNKVQKEKVRR